MFKLKKNYKQIDSKENCWFIESACFNLNYMSDAC